jgi:uncharacterized damage-inducible protein DinB
VDALVLLRDQAANADRILLQVFSPVTPEQAAWRAPGSIANTIGATFMHVYYSEDQMIHGAQGSRTVFESGNWHERLGYDPAAAWSFSGKPDPVLLVEYAGAVSAETRDYLSGLDPQALEREVETPRGPQPMASRLSGYLVVHKSEHTGEIAALLGGQGVKGLPF